MIDKIKDVYNIIVDFYSKYRIVINIAIISIIVASMLRNCQKIEQPIVLNSEVISQQEVIIANLTADKKDLTDSVIKYRLLLKNSESKNKLLVANHQVVINKIKEYPLTKGCELLQGNFVDTAKLKIINYGANFSILISPKQVIEANICFEDKSYLIASNDVKDYQISTLIKIDIANRSIIKNDSFKLEASNVIISENKKSINMLIKENEKLTKKVNRNKFFRNSTLAVLAGVLVVAFVK